ncbi:hypothetical protein JOB18_034538 [Solea senegalensis]|uniref:Uncharacterized protein n=1 Tax=Solea senegalensis TaxID=28829 RepID=A0AAV6PIL9_SOLSE|nr:hypothetical protein JOB18_001466 [Solea senegalensis]KAG7461483.1 hypothetical protein JOB18_034538 [Solea senegalensis]
MWRPMTGKTLDTEVANRGAASKAAGDTIAKPTAFLTESTDCHLGNPRRGALRSPLSQPAAAPVALIVAETGHRGAPYTPRQTIHRTNTNRKSLAGSIRAA